MRTDVPAIAPGARSESRVRRALRWVAPGVGLALIPKCPACLAGYLALLIGVGVSLPVAQALRIGWLVVCAGALAWLVASRVWRAYRPRARRGFGRNDAVEGGAG